MNCQKAQYLIQEYLENEINFSEQTQLARHLLECAECREEMNQMEQADAYFSSQPLFSPPESLQENIMARLSSVHPEIEGTELEIPRKSSRRLWYIFLSLGQICLAIGMLIAVRPEWLLPAIWFSFLKRHIDTTILDWLLGLKTSVEHLWSTMAHTLLDKVSFGSKIYDFLVQPSWVKLSLLFILLFLTFYLNKRLLFTRRGLSGKV